MRAWGGVGNRVPVPAPIPVQICGKLLMLRSIPHNAGIYPSIVDIFCGCPLNLGSIAIPINEHDFNAIPSVKLQSID